jgi:hypothetical protein
MRQEMGMSIAFLGATKNMDDEKLEQALCAMRSADPPQKKIAVLKLIAKCREMPESYPVPVSHKA